MSVSDVSCLSRMVHGNQEKNRSIFHVHVELLNVSSMMSLSPSGKISRVFEGLLEGV